MARDPQIDLWAVDEVHFQQYGSGCRMWIPPETKDPVLRHHPTRNSVGYFGAVRLRDGRFVYQREPNKFDGPTFFRFLKQLRQASCHSGRRVIAIVDNASFHHAGLHRAWREQASARFALEFLPPYSPELNPSERVWKLTRRQATHNQYFPTLEAIVECVENQFSQWRPGNQTLRRLCAIT